MTSTQEREKFDFRWTVLGAVCVAAASVSLLQISWASAIYTLTILIGVVFSGAIGRRRPTSAGDASQFMLLQRSRMIVLAIIAPLAAFAVRSNKSSLVVVAGAMLWLVSISTFLQIATRYVPERIAFLVYVQYVGDFWVALFLAISGADWLIVAAVLAIAAPTAASAPSQQDKRLLPVIVLSVAALFLFGVPPSARLFAIYLTAVISLSAWSAHHLSALASHLRGLTASESDVSITR